MDCSQVVTKAEVRVPAPKMPAEIVDEVLRVSRMVGKAAARRYARAGLDAEELTAQALLVCTELWQKPHYRELPKKAFGTLCYVACNRQLAHYAPRLCAPVSCRSKGVPVSVLWRTVDLYAGNFRSPITRERALSGPLATVGSDELGRGNDTVARTPAQSTEDMTTQVLRARPEDMVDTAAEVEIDELRTRLRARIATVLAGKPAAAIAATARCLLDGATVEDAAAAEGCVVSYIWKCNASVVRGLRADSEAMRLATELALERDWQAA